MAVDVRGLETGLLGLEGFRLAGAVEEDGEAPAGRRLLSGRGVKAAGGGRRRKGGGRPRCGICLRAGGRWCWCGGNAVGGAQTQAAGEVLDRGQRGGAAPVGAVGTRPQRSSPPSRPRRNAGSGGGSGVGGQPAYRDERRPGDRRFDGRGADGGPAGVRRLGKGRGARRWRKRPGRRLPGFCGLDTGRLVEVVQGRSGAAARGFFRRRPAEDRRQIEAAALDPWRGYLRAVRKELPDAAVTVDRFHSSAWPTRPSPRCGSAPSKKPWAAAGGKVIPSTGSAVCWSTDRNGSPSANGRRSTPAPLAAYGEVSSAWEAKELLREVYTAPDAAGARQRLEGFHQWARIIAVPEVERLSRTLRVWEAETLNFHLTGITNRRRRSPRPPHRKTRRIGHGYRNPNNYRLRFLLHCGVIRQLPEQNEYEAQTPLSRA